MNNEKENNIKDLNDEINKLKEDIKNKDLEIEELKQKLNDLYNLSNDNNDKNNLLNDEYEKLKEKYNELLNENEDDKNKLKNYENKYKNLEDENNKLRSNQNPQNNNDDELNKKINDMNDELKKLKNDLENKNNEYNKLNSAYKNSIPKFMELSNKLKQKNKEIEDLKNQLNNNNNDNINLLDLDDKNLDNDLPKNDDEQIKFRAAKKRLFPNSPPPDEINEEILVSPVDIKVDDDNIKLQNKPKTEINTNENNDDIIRFVETDGDNMDNLIKSKIDIYKKLRNFYNKYEHNKTVFKNGLFSRFRFWKRISMNKKKDPRIIMNTKLYYDKDYIKNQLRDERIHNFVLHCKFLAVYASNIVNNNNKK